MDLVSSIVEKHTINLVVTSSSTNSRWEMFLLEMISPSKSGKTKRAILKLGKSEKWMALFLGHTMKMQKTVRETRKTRVEATEEVREREKVIDATVKAVEEEEEVSLVVKIEIEAIEAVKEKEEREEIEEVVARKAAIKAEEVVVVVVVIREVVVEEKEVVSKWHGKVAKTEKVKERANQSDKQNPWSFCARLAAK